MRERLSLFANGVDGGEVVTDEVIVSSTEMYGLKADRELVLGWTLDGGVERISPSSALLALMLTSSSSTSMSMSLPLPPSDPPFLALPPDCSGAISPTRLATPERLCDVSERVSLRGAAQAIVS